MISNFNSPTPFVFIHANKTGGNAINKALDNYGYKYPNDYNFTHNEITFPHSQHWTLQELSMVVNIDEHYTFSISRNPWDRMVSYYRKNVCNPVSDAWVNADFNDWVEKAFVEKSTPEYQDRIDERYVHKGPQYSKIHDGIRNIEECYYYMLNSEGEIGVDYVIEFSLLNKGFKEVSKNLGLDLILKEVPQMRSNIRTHNGRFYDIKSYHEMYNNKSIDIIQNNFSNDIKFFNYEYE